MKNASALRLLDHPDRQRADRVPRSRPAGTAANAGPAQTQESASRDEVVCARSLVGLGRTGARRFSTHATRTRAASFAQRRPRKTRTRLAPRRRSQRSARPLRQREASPRQARGPRSARRSAAASGLAAPPRSATAKRLATANGSAAAPRRPAAHRPSTAKRLAATHGTAAAQGLAAAQRSATAARCAARQSPRWLVATNRSKNRIGLPSPWGKAAVGAQDRSTRATS